MYSSDDMIIGGARSQSSGNFLHLEVFIAIALYAVSCGENIKRFSSEDVF